MNDKRMVKTWSLVALGAVGVLPFAAACTNPNNQQAVSPYGSAGYGYGQPGYGQPGYGQYPQPGYAQPGQPGYPARSRRIPPPVSRATRHRARRPGIRRRPPLPASPSPGQPAPGQPAPTGSAPGPLAPTDPGSLQGILQGLQTAIQGQIAPQGGGGGGGVGGDVTMLGLKAYALHVAPGMQPDGDELKQTLQQGQHAVVMFTMQAGKCYSVVGFSPRRAPCPTSISTCSRRRST